MNVDYGELAKVVAAITADETDLIANMATLTCEVFHADTRFDWVGFYRNMGNDTLKIGPYQGGHGCLSIPFDRGVCGAAARTGKIQIVDDVQAFDGHIACASSTRSEIVLPVFDKAGALIAVFDIDSDQPAAFLAEDQLGLQAMLTQVFSRA